MKTLKLLTLVGLGFVMAVQASAANRQANLATTTIRPNPKAFAKANRVAKTAAATTKQAGNSTASKNAGYSTSHSFEGSKIQGQLQEGSLRRIMVENDKSIDDLLGVRKQFDDRELEETERNLSW